MSPDIPELSSCQVCPQNCGVNRYLSTGFCGADARLQINLAQLHHGEEPVLSGDRGSGTIFFSHCNLRCCYCQNHSISHLGWGTYYSAEECAKLMLKLQNAGAHNINLVSPTHYTIQLIEVIQIARSKGLNIPIVWNSNAFEHVKTLGLLRGLVQIYLPDYKYAHSLYSQKYSQAKDFPRLALQAIQEMYAQVGDLQFDAAGMAVKGVLIRHLVLPNGLAGTRKALYAIRETLGSEVSLSLMAQYYPNSEAASYPELNRGIDPGEYAEALDTAQSLGFSRIYAQELSASADWTPEFLQPGTAANPDKLHFKGRENHA